MEKLDNEQTELESQAAEAEEVAGDGKREVSLGKFKSVDALLSAYGSLEAEFTKRCQRIKELESAQGGFIDKEKAPIEKSEPVTEQPKREISEEEKEKILKEYLYSVLGRKQSAIVMEGGGVGVKTPKERPKTLREAGILAGEILKGSRSTSD